MAFNPQKLKPADVVRLCNSTQLGPVLDERQLYRHRMRAGFKIGDGRHVDLFRYVAWLTHDRHAPRILKDPTAEYEAMKAAAASRNRDLSAAGRDIGALPAVVDPDRRARAEWDFKLFCRSYFPQTFHLSFSPTHLRVIDKVEQAVLHGGLFAMAMPRGGGKTSIAECACLWAVLYGHKEFACLIGASEAHAVDMLDSIKMELEGNDVLAGDFPEVCHPIRCLEGIPNRCSGQLCKGARTYIGWTANEVVLPQITGSQASGAVIRVTGITGRIRGMKFKQPNGKTVRPGLVILDDPQTDESARSDSQCADREAMIKGAVLGLAGPGRKISCVMPCTIIRDGDLASRFLDHEKHPSWQGETSRLVERWPDRADLWEKYTDLRKDEDLRGDHEYKASTTYYLENRTEMDRGAAVSWSERKGENEVSAIQHAYNLLARVGETAFWAEYQNEPKRFESSLYHIDVDVVMKRVNYLGCNQLPENNHFVVAGIDVNHYALTWVVLAARTDFTVFVADYGVYPPYGVLWEQEKNVTLERAVFEGLNDLVQTLLARQNSLGTVLIDGNYCTKAVFQAVEILDRKFPANIRIGRGRSAENYRMLSAKDPKLIGKPGDHCHFQHGQRGREVPFDSHYWHMILQKAFLLMPGQPGSISLWGDEKTNHRTFAEHICSERLLDYYFRNGEARYQWGVPSGKNDLADAMCLALAGVSMLGADAIKPPAVVPTGRSAVPYRPRRVPRIRCIEI